MMPANTLSKKRRRFLKDNFMSSRLKIRREIFYRHLLEAIFRNQSDHSCDLEYAALAVCLEYSFPKMKISKKSLIRHCKEIDFLSGGACSATEKTVELKENPEDVLLLINQKIKDMKDSR